MSITQEQLDIEKHRIHVLENKLLNIETESQSLSEMILETASRSPKLLKTVMKQQHELSVIEANRKTTEVIKSPDQLKKHEADLHHTRLMFDAKLITLVFIFVWGGTGALIEIFSKIFGGF